MKKKKKFKNKLNFRLTDSQFIDLTKKHKKFNHLLINHSHTVSFINTHSWFYANKGFHSKVSRLFPLKTDFIKNDEPVKAVRINLYPNDSQKKILLNWMNIYIDMQNETIKYLRKLRFDKLPLILNWKKLRNQMKHIKLNVLNKSRFDGKTINAHILDKAIQDVTIQYKSAISNQKNTGRSFRIRYIKKTKKKKIVKLEKIMISRDKKTFCRTVFGDIFNCSHSDFSKITSDFTIQFDEIKNKFFLFYTVPVKKVNIQTKKQIALDPGIRTFLTGYASDHHIEFARNLQEEIRPLLEETDELNGSKLKESKIKKAVRKRELKISNKIDDLHWKVIKYLTDNYKEIVIGNYSTKKSGELNIDKMTKRIGSRMRLYVFKERLKYKCSIKGTKYLEVNEAYTSKLCSQCGNHYDENLGSKKIYECLKCKRKIGRDINGARNIMIKGT